MEIVCRICFMGYSHEDCLPLSSPSSFSSIKTIVKLLKHVIPEMNISLIKDSYICAICWNIISQFYKLKLKCLQNEQNFFEFLAKNNWQGNIHDFVISSQIVKEENEIEFEEKPDALVANNSGYFNEEPGSLLSYQEYTIGDSDSEERIPLVEPNDVEDAAKTNNEKPEEDKMLTCSSCLTDCINFKEALSHAIGFHGVHLILCCSSCSSFFMELTSLREHLKTHWSNLSCQFCDEVFIAKGSLTRHLKTHPEYVALKEQERFRCPYCNLIFDVFRAFKKHRRTHFRALYTCEVCGKSHSNNDLIEEHRLIHGNTNRYMCEKCGQCFKQKSRLWWHNHKYHVNVKTRKCSYCPKKFFRSYDLKAHEVVHTREKNYECHICSKRFTRPGNKMRHMRVHTGEKYHCNDCGRSYAQSNDLKKHLCRAKADCGVTESNEISMVKCQICNRVFKRNYIKIHVRSHTGEKPEVCKVCGKGFTNLGNLARHMMIHTGQKPHKCNECGRRFIQKVDYDAHMRRKHTGERPYECKVCNKSFIEFSVLHRHRKSRSHQIAIDSVKK